MANKKPIIVNVLNINYIKIEENYLRIGMNGNDFTLFGKPEDILADITTAAKSARFNIDLKDMLHED
jgi:hypothetical protein